MSSASPGGRRNHSFVFHQQSHINLGQPGSSTDIFIMRLIKRNINRDGSGSVTLCPEEPEDMVCQAPTSNHLLKPANLLLRKVACLQPDSTFRPVDRLCNTTCHD